MNNNRLELTWVGKYDPDNKINPEPRILIERPEYSYSAEPKEQCGNMLIHGDNLLALKSLQQEYSGRIKCIYIDPPYNTGSAFEHYDDNLEHSTWLNLMKPRLELLRQLLADDGSIWISIDDDEGHYLKVICDDVFGRNNFINTVIWEKKYAPQGNAQWLTDSHDFILLYAKNKSIWKPNLLPRTKSMNEKYKNPDNDPRGLWRSDNATISLSGGQRGAQYARTGVSANIYELKAPNGKTYLPPKGRCWYYPEDKMYEAIKEGRIFFGKDGMGAPQLKRYMSEVKQGVGAMTLWKRDEVGDNQDAKREVRDFNADSVFATPKPERLIERIITLATNPGDIVLDSFLGSGTAAAVAHKMGRRWIGIELGDHAYTHCYPRLKAVIDGEQGGISKSVEWNGGGGFKFYELAPTLIKKDKYGNSVISDEYNAEMLAQAMAKHEGYTYLPDENYVWKQGFSDDKNYIFTTTSYISSEYLDYIASELPYDEYLLICGDNFEMECVDRYKNITIHPIPKMLLGRCEFGKSNYDLNIVLQDSGKRKVEDDEDWGDADE